MARCFRISFFLLSGLLMPGLLAGCNAEGEATAGTDGPGQGAAGDDDADGDGVADDVDNCPSAANAGQEDLDNDGAGDACDEDMDGDGINNADDNCPGIANPNQADTDGDGVPDQLVDAPAYGAGPAGPMGGRIGRMYLFSGATGELIRKIDNPTQQPGSGFGFQDA
ncbi:MAG: thrombospondin type 3 repeat-containing protein, partial [Proteobacteria bacterium]|nr:thrombospondin type 3 repeat-containing protein [Pseudomonadota bacterium]